MTGDFDGAVQNAHSVSEATRVNWRPTASGGME